MGLLRVNPVRLSVGVRYFVQGLTAILGWGMLLAATIYENILQCKISIILQLSIGHNYNVILLSKIGKSFDGIGIIK